MNNIHYYVLLHDPKLNVDEVAPNGVRTAGRPKLRWEYRVDQDMRTSDVKNWKKVALDRDEWARLLKKARAHHGLSSQ